MLTECARVHVCIGAARRVCAIDIENLNTCAETCGVMYAKGHFCVFLCVCVCFLSMIVQKHCGWDVHDRNVCEYE